MLEIWPPSAARPLHGLRHERGVVVVCDAARKVLRVVVLTEGVADRSPIAVGDVLATVLATGGTAFGGPQPSQRSP